MKKRMSWFARIYIVVSIFLICLLTVASCFLWTVLEAYENSRPKAVAQTVFDTYFVEKDIDGILKYNTIGNDFETEEMIKKAVSDQLDGKELNYISVSNDGENQKYAVTADGVRVAYFTLTQSGEEYKYGFKGYELTDIDFYVGANVNKTIIVPEGYTLNVNSVVVGDDYITQSQMAHYTNEYLPDGEKGLFLNQYTIDGFCVEPKIKVLSPDGNEVELVLDGETNVLSADFVYDEALKNEYSKYAIEVVSTYTAAMSKDATKSDFYQYVDKKSEFYKKFKNVETWFWPHDGHKITNAEASQFIRHSDDVFSCRVKLTQELYLKKKTEYNHVDIILYMRKVNGKFLVYNAVTNG